MLTHWGRVMYLFVSKPRHHLVYISQGVTWPNDSLVWIGPLGPNCGDIWIKNTAVFMQEYEFENVVCKMANILSWAQCFNFRIAAIFVRDLMPLVRKHGTKTASVVAVLKHWVRDKMAAVLRTTFSNSFPWMKIFEFRLKFRWNMFPGVQLTISQHWFR